MGRERSVLCWDIHASLLRSQIEQAQAELAEIEKGHAVEAAGNRLMVTRLAATLADLRRQLHDLGPSPRARMG